MATILRYNIRRPPSTIIYRTYRPRVSYAKRQVCLACHQNGALIWPQSVWDETNANEDVALGIAAARKMQADSKLYGIPIHVPVAKGALLSHASLAENSDNVADGRLPPGVPSQFKRLCASCHNTPESFPPNFLYGREDRVAALLGRCAERIFFRLAMWSLPPARRPKSPMPPVSALESLGINPERWHDSGDLKTLSRFAARLAVARAPNLSDVDALLGRPYTDSLECASSRHP